MYKGTIHSMESMGLVDGPGIRTVVFMQGCTLRCQFCHNPDTWGMDGGSPITVAQLVDKLKRYKTYYQKSGGGVTFSGGEPLMQPQFLEEALKACQAEDIHTCIETAGAGPENPAAILAHTDLVILDLKHHDPQGFQALTGQSMERTLAFMEALSQAGTPTWVRHVVVPGLTDNKAHLRAMAKRIKTLPQVENVELLGYHELGVHKYETMGIPYHLAGTPAMDSDALARCQQCLDAELEKEHV